MEKDDQLARVDLNLLYAFKVLMEETNVSRAAERLFITQPAMSNKLHRLRELFDDPLFVRAQHGLSPTPKATQLISPVEAALSQLATTVFQSPFDPAQAYGSVNIQVPDSFSINLIPPLYKRLSEAAPHLKLTSDNATNEHLDLLAAGKADFSIYVANDYGDDFFTYDIGSSPSVCWMRNKHPLCNREVVTIEEIREFPLAELTFLRQAPKTQIEAGPGRRLRELQEIHQLDKATKVGSTQLLTLLAIVLATDTLLIGASFLSNLNPYDKKLIYKSVQEYANLQVPLVLIQHRRTEKSPLHSWLRTQILNSWGATI